jgi:hypothetical protein
MDCECCGKTLDSRRVWIGQDTLGVRGGIKAREMRRNRSRVPDYRSMTAWQARLTAAGIASWAGKLACGDCLQHYSTVAQG